MPVPKNQKRKKIEMIDMDGNVVDEYDSESHAARANYMNKSAVSERCLGRVKKPFISYEYTFRFKEEI